MAHDPLDEQIASADPICDNGPEVRGALDALREEILDMPITTFTGPSRRKRAVIAVTVVAALGLGAGAAAADGFFARTGLFGSGGEEGTGELIRLDAPDASEVIAEVGGDIALPAGGSFDDLTASMSGEPTEMTESALRSTLEFDAACQWTTSWLDAEAAGDTTTMAEAQATLDAVPTWPALVASDPTRQQSNRPAPEGAPIPLADQGAAVLPGDGGVIAMWQAIADAARAGDPQAVQDSGYTVNCTDIGPGQ